MTVSSKWLQGRVTGGNLFTKIELSKGQFRPIISDPSLTQVVSMLSKFHCLLVAVVVASMLPTDVANALADTGADHVVEHPQTPKDLTLNLKWAFDGDRLLDDRFYSPASVKAYFGPVEKWPIRREAQDNSGYLQFGIIDYRAYAKYHGMYAINGTILSFRLFVGAPLFKPDWSGVAHSSNQDSGSDKDQYKRAEWQIHHTRLTYRDIIDIFGDEWVEDPNAPENDPKSGLFHPHDHSHPRLGEARDYHAAGRHITYFGPKKDKKITVYFSADDDATITFYVVSAEQTSHQ